MDNCGRSWELMHALSERILISNSATSELERWCSERSIGDGRLVALCDRNASFEPLDDESREALYPFTAAGPTGFRRVQLASAGTVVVEALNWYFPEHLTLQMRDLLEATDMPFGRVVAPLKPKRRTFHVKRCLREGLERGDETNDFASTIFEHRALVQDETGKPLAIVHERFLFALLRGAASAGEPESRAGGRCAA